MNFLTHHNIYLLERFLNQTQQPWSRVSQHVCCRPTTRIRTRSMEDNLYPPHADPECHRRKRGARSERTLSSSPPLWEWGYTSVHRKPLSDAQISCEGLRRSSAGM